MATSSNENEKTRKWKAKIEKLIFSKHVCGVCFRDKETLMPCDTVFQIEKDDCAKTYLLKDVIDNTFGYEISNLLVSSHLCQDCIDTILKAHRMINEIHLNHTMLMKHINVIMEQTKHGLTNTQNDCQLMLTVDNVTSLNVPNTVTVQQNKKELTPQIFLCEVNDSNQMSSNLPKSNLNYECPYCGKEINDYNEFKTHYTSHTETSFKCITCMKKFCLFEKYIEHRNNVHLESISFCKTCQIIVHGNGIEEHENLHNNEMFICDYCNMLLSTKTALKRHISQFHIVSFQCQYCLNSFPTHFKLNHHRCLFKCLECKENCIHEDYLTSYRQQYMANESTFQCTDCEFKYKTRSQLIRHVNEFHLLHFPYLCDHCGESFPSKPILTSHMYKKHIDLDILNDTDSAVSKVFNNVSESLECDQCVEQFLTEEAYTRHMKKHLMEQTQCAYCSTVFNNLSRLNMHIKSRHPNESGHKSIIYQCTMCLEDFDKRSVYLRHVQTHPEDSEHVCRTCNATFSSKTTYFSHIRKHSINYDRECPICFKLYTKHTLARHLKAHTKEKKEDSDRDQSIYCDVCGISLPNERGLVKHSQQHTEFQQCNHCNKIVSSVLYNRHIRSHKLTPDKKWKTCNKCNYKTTISVCLEAHVNRYHLKIRPFQCYYCDKKFYSEYTLKGHQETHNTDRPELFCQVCGNKFISKKALVLHTRIHTGETPYPCDMCDQSFLSASRRKQHKIRKHFEPSLECELCHKKFYTKSDLRRHFFDCHDMKKRARKARVAAEGESIETA